MKKLFQVEAGRYWLLITCFLLLAATLFLIYQHPSDRVKDLKTDDYEKNTLDKWYSQAEFLLKRGDWDQAKNLALKISLSSPENLFAQRVMVRVYVEKGNLEKAAELCREVIYKNPEAALSRNNLAVILHIMHHPDAANEISLALRLMSEHPVIKYNYSRITGNPLPETEKAPGTSQDLLIVNPASNGDSHE